MFSGVKFKYSFRDYQQRVLDSLQDKLMDNRIHVVAAPGSGKTVLGLEIIIRLGRPVLILVPSISLRQQWCDRFLNLFANNQEEWRDRISFDISNPRIITCCTYQALYSQFNEDNFHELVEKYNNAGISTICLDEAHHLKREWWKALEELQAGIKENVVISLTATPPYDSSDAEWVKYNKLCGEIDIEIFIPEMVQKRCLCPHQDYVALCIPTEDEVRSIDVERKENLDSINSILKSKELYYQIKRRLFLNESSTDVFVNQPEYLLSVMSYIKNYWMDKVYEYEDGREAAQKVIQSIDINIKKALASDEIPEMDLYYFEILMQGIIEFDKDAYEANYVEELKHILVKNHFIYKDKLIITKNEDKLEDKLKNSTSKLKMIETIVKHESENMRDELRCVVLVDHVRKEDLSKIATMEELTDLGCVPVFERLRRMEHNGNLEAYMNGVELSSKSNRTRLGMVTGGLVILPNDCIENIGLAWKELGITGYSYANIQDSESNATVIKVTELLTVGKITVLIGTAALLGEGWDAPCVNTVVIGSVACTYVQSNQMRGRGLRIDSKNERKVANIWHLTTVVPDRRITSEYKKICQRFEAITGISYDGTRIENGIQKIGLKNPLRDIKFSIEEIFAHQNITFKYSADRERTYRLWNDFIGKYGDLSKIRVVNEVPVKPRRIFADSRKKMFIHGSSVIFTTLKDMGLISNRVKLEFSENDKNKLGVYLFDATSKENAIFSDSLNQFLSPVYKAKYIIEKKYLFGKKEYYVIPDVFCRRKEDAQMFINKIGKKGTKLIYSKSQSDSKKIFEIRMRELRINRKHAEIIKMVCND